MLFYLGYHQRRPPPSRTPQAHDHQRTQLHTPSLPDGSTSPCPSRVQPSRMTKPPTCPTSPLLLNGRPMQAKLSVLSNSYELSDALTRNPSRPHRRRHTTRCHTDGNNSRPSLHTSLCDSSMWQPNYGRLRHNAAADGSSNRAKRPKSDLPPATGHHRTSTENATTKGPRTRRSTR